MRLSEDIDFTTLTWVKSELDETLKQARHALEAYVEDPADASQMRFCATYLHQVQGTLRMVELYGAAMVTEEMEQLATALLENQVSERDEAYTVLMRGIVQLPDYLERLQSGHRDIPIVLLPLLNELRSARGEKGLSESVLFTPDLGRPLPEGAGGPAKAMPELELRQLAEQLRGQFQLSLLNWFRGLDADANITRMSQVCDHLVTVTQQEEARRLFWVAAGVLDALRARAFEPSPQLKQTIGKVEREIKRLADAGESSFRVDPPRELTRNLLYFVAHAPTDHGRIGELRDVFRLDQLLPSDAELQHARGAMSGHNRALLDTVAGAIKEDLLRVKDALDLHMRSSSASPADLGGQVDVLDRVADTLGMLGLGVARRVVQDQRDAVSQVAGGSRAGDESTLLDIAGALLYVEASLDDQVQHLGSAMPGAEGERALPQAEARKVLDAVVKEAQSNFAQAKQCFVAFVESSWDHAQLQDVPRLLDEVAGALRIMELTEAPQYLHGVRRFTENELLVRHRVPNAQQMDTLADALASLEYYLEALRDQRPNRDKILAVTRESLEGLGYWPVPEQVAESEPSATTVATEPAQPAETARSAHSATGTQAGDDADADAGGQGSEGVVFTDGIPERREDSTLAELSPVQVAPGTGMEDLLVGEREGTALAPPPAAQDMAGFRPALTERTAPPGGQGGFEATTDDIDEEIREVFIEEVQEEITNLETLLPLWKSDPGNVEHLKPIRRVFHTLKGSGRLVGAMTLGEFSWKIENMLNRVLDHTVQPSSAAQALVEHALHALPELLASLRGAGQPNADIEQLKELADRIVAGEQAWYVPRAAAAPDAAEPVLQDADGSESLSVEAQAEDDAATMEAEDLVETIAVPTIDPVLFEILRAEVAGHLETVDAWLARCDAHPVPVDDPLLRAIHTMNGAFAMTEVPTITEVISPLEGYIKRLLAQQAAPNRHGVELLAQSVHAVRTCMLALESDHPRLPPLDALAEQVTVARDALPEPVGPSIPVHPDAEGFFSDTAQPAADEDMAGDAVEPFEATEAAVFQAEASERAALESEASDPEAAASEATESEATESEAIESEAIGDAAIEAEAIEAEAIEAEAIEAEAIEAEAIEADAVEARQDAQDDADDAARAAVGTAQAEHEEEMQAELEAELEAEFQAQADASSDAVSSEIAHAGVDDAATTATADADSGESLAAPETMEQELISLGDAEGAAAALGSYDFELVEYQHDGEVQALQVDSGGHADGEYGRPSVVELPADGHDAALAALFDAFTDDAATRGSDAGTVESASELDALALESEPGSVADADADADADAESDAGTVEFAHADFAGDEEPQQFVSADGSDAALPGTDHIDAGRAEAERAESERAEAERAEAERAEAERAEAERAEAERAEAERVEAERAEAERAEAERAEAERAEAERAEAERAEAERVEAERVEAERVEAERVEAERVEAERIEAERAEAERVEAERVEAERVEAERAEAAFYAQVAEEERRAAEASATADAQPAGEAVEYAAQLAHEGSATASTGGIVDPDEPLDTADMDEELLDIFLEEGGDILDHSDGLLAGLRQNPADRELVVGLQRDLHTLKGGARMAGLPQIGDLGHAMESLLEAVADGRRELHGSGVEVLERSFDRLHAMVLRVGDRRAVAMPVALIDRVEALVRGEVLEAPVPVTSVPAQMPEGSEGVVEPGPLSEPLYEEEEEVAAITRAPQEQIRIRADLLDRLVNYAGEVAIYRARLEQQLGTFRGSLTELEATTSRLREQLRRLEIETEAQIIARFQREAEVAESSFDPLELDRFSTLQQLSRALGESAADLVNLQGTLDDQTRQYETLLLQQSRVSSDLQEGLMRTRMVPFDALVPRLRRILRQTCGELGKKAQLRVDGAQGEMDRTVLDRMTAPLEHMLRNALAHGMETPKERARKHKPEEGTVRIAVNREGSEVVIRVSDDGRGMDRDAIRRKAIERGLMKPDAQLSDRDLYGFILETGFSTAETVTKIAGRGVGMDVVNSEIKQLGGSLFIESEAGKGTTFIVRLPFTMAVTQAVFVQLGETSFAVPISSVQGVARIGRRELEEQLASGAPSYEYAGEHYAIYDLGLLLGQSHVRAEESLQIPLLLARSGDLLAAICVDQVIGSREIVVKPSGPQVSSVPGIFGATVMGDGRVVVILDVAPLVRRSAAMNRIGDAPVLPAAAPEVRRVPLVMVVDDSITMRKVTGRVLERNNYEVMTAKDGVDAIEKLQDRLPDVMLLDIEMPRMDGYELATHMRNDPRLRNVPIIMITSRTGDKHRQRAFEIGVDRYLGKPYQETELMRNVNEILESGRVNAR